MNKTTRLTLLGAGMALAMSQATAGDLTSTGMSDLNSVQNRVQITQEGNTGISPYDLYTKYAGQTFSCQKRSYFNTYYTNYIEVKGWLRFDGEGKPWARVWVRNTRGGLEQYCRTGQANLYCIQADTGWQSMWDGGSTYISPMQATLCGGGNPDRYLTRAGGSIGVVTFTASASGELVSKYSDGDGFCGVPDRAYFADAVCSINLPRQ